MASELWRSSAVELARRIAAHEVSSRDVVEAHLERIAEVNPALNAVTLVLAEQARAAADAADRAVADRAELGPLHGVPFTVKENIDLAGTATTQGLPALAGSVAPSDAPVVERMRRAGAIPIARTNLPDLGLRVHTESSLHGLTRNPWHPGRTAGGSSGGEASAIASGMSPLGLGNDIGGSLRNPAHCCGIAALKPSSGRVPHVSVLPPEDPNLASQLMFVEGPMARRVEDLRVALAILAGPHPGDPFVVAAPLAGPALPRPIRVVVMEAPPGAPTQPDVQAAVRRAADVLAEAGYAVAAGMPPLFERTAEVWGAWLINELRPMLPLFAQVMGAEAMKFLGHVAVRFPEVDLATMTQLLTERHRIAREWAEFQEQSPLVLSPVWTETAFPHGRDVASEADAFATLDLIRCILPANLLGLPAAVVPAAVADGLPIGVQIAGPRFREDLCLDAAAAIEGALGILTPIDPQTA